MAALRAATLRAVSAGARVGPSKRRRIDRRDEPPAPAGQPVFQQIVGGAAFHGRDGVILADRPGDDDEGNVEPALARERQRAQRVEPGQRVIGDDDVEIRR